MQRREFLKSCLYLSCFLGAGYTINTLTDNYRKRGYLEYLELPLAQHCNLDCKFCTHFSCIAKEEIYSLEKYTQDMEKLSNITDKKLLKLALMGGEPLLHPQLSEIFKVSRKYFPNTYIYVVTNAILLDSLDNKVYNSMVKNDIKMVPSIYNINVNWDKLKKMSKKYNFALYIPEGLNNETIKKYAVKNFYKLNLDLTGSQNINCFHKCSERYTYMYDGKLYPCPIIGNIQHFNSHFDKNLIVTPEDTLELNNTKNINEIFSFLKTPKNFCKYCRKITPARKNEPWSCTLNHKISEWT